MKTETIFVIHGEEATKKQSSLRKNGRNARDSDNPSINYWSGLHVFTILCCSGLVMSILTLIPRHNSLLDQSYWFEINIVVAIAYFTVTASTVLDFLVLFEKNSLVTIRLFLKSYLATFVTWIVCFCTIYMIWTMMLDYNHPMPWIGFIVHVPTKIVSSIS